MNPTDLLDTKNINLHRNISSQFHSRMESEKKLFQTISLQTILFHTILFQTIVLPKSEGSDLQYKIITVKMSCMGQRV